MSVVAGEADDSWVVLLGYMDEEHIMSTEQVLMFIIAHMLKNPSRPAIISL
jgi:hypothetical protein